MINSTKIKNLSDIPLDERTSTPETVREGVGASPGIVIGRVFVYNTLLKAVPQYAISEQDVITEEKRFLAAVSETANQFDSILNRAKNVLEGDPLGSLFDVYRHMLKGSRLIRGVRHRIKHNLINAEAAVQTEVSSIAEVFEAMEDVYISARIEDIRSVGVRILRNLQSQAKEKLVHLPENTVVIGSDLSPADTALLNLNNISGFAIAGSSAQSHAALLARSIGMPAVVGVPELIKEAKTGDVIIIDGTYGKVILRPSQENVSLYRKYRSDFLNWKRSLSRISTLACQTTDNHLVELKGNVDLPHEVDVLLQTGAQGIGLMRSEYMFFNRKTLPSEDEQFEILKKICTKMQGKSVTFRILDVGGDKCPDMLHTLKAENPALGLRGIRFALKSKGLLKTQFNAVLRARVYGTIRILLPMVTSVDEVLEAKRLLLECYVNLKDKGVELPENVPELGVMIETPAAALETALIAANCDFLSIGTNDLVQYTLAVDRADASVSYLFNPLHPSLLKLLKIIIDEANKSQTPLGICGEMASNYRYAPLLVGLGFKELSMPAINIPMVKEKIRSLSLSEAENFANHLLSLSLPQEIIEAFENFGSNNR